MFGHHLRKLSQSIWGALLSPLKVVTFIACHGVLLLPESMFYKCVPFAHPLLMLCLSFNPNIRVIDERDHKRSTLDPAIIVYQHSTYADHYILFGVFGALKYVLLEKYLESPLIKPFLARFGYIAVGIGATTKGIGARTKIISYVRDGGYEKERRKLAIAPEGGRVLNASTEGTV